MARPKKEATEETIEAVIPTPVAKLPVDYPSEGLNNMARKINELIDLYESIILGK